MIPINHIFNQSSAEHNRDTVPPAKYYQRGGQEMYQAMQELYGEHIFSRHILIIHLSHPCLYLTLATVHGRGHSSRTWLKHN
jgi:hypothetical protein